MKVNKLIAVPAIALAAGISLAACGSSGPPTNSAQIAGALVGTQNTYGVSVTSATCGSWSTQNGTDGPGASCEVQLSDGTSYQVTAWVAPNGSVHWQS
jgi:hypothetical protein